MSTLSLSCKSIKQKIVTGTGVRRTKLIAVLCLLFVIITGCAAPLPPAQDATDLNAIAGEWKGYVTSFSGKDYSSKLVIQENGQYQVDAPGLEGSPYTGIISIVGGQYKAISSVSKRTFTYTLHEGTDERILIGKADDGKNGGKYKQKK